jgi:hypothetical protein
MSVENRRSIIDIINLNPNNADDFKALKDEYRAVDIDKVKINGNTFTNYGAYSFIWEKTYIKSPSRAGDGSIRDLDAHATFLTGHLIIDFSIISIDDYRALMQLHYAKNEFTVECYDPIYNTKIVLNMYFATEEMAKLHIINRRIWNNAEWEDWLVLAGVRDYQLEMISTNSDLNLVSVTYHLNPPTNVTAEDSTVGEPSVYMGEELIIGGGTDFQSENFGGIYKFTSWNTKADGTGTTYLDGYAYTMNTDLVLYAQWESMTEHKLTFSYGVADLAMQESGKKYETVRTVVEGKSIGKLPVPDMPYVKYAKQGNPDETEIYFPYDYTTKGWYKIAELTENASEYKIKDDDPYWKNRDGSAYLLFSKKKLKVKYCYYKKGGVVGQLNEFQTLEVCYGEEVPMIDFHGTNEWYYYPYSADDKKEAVRFTGKMPPYSELVLFSGVMGD